MPKVWPAAYWKWVLLTPSLIHLLCWKFRTTLRCATESVRLLFSAATMGKPGKSTLLKPLRVRSKKLWVITLRIKLRVAKSCANGAYFECWRTSFQPIWHWWHVFVRKIRWLVLRVVLSALLLSVKYRPCFRRMHLQKKIRVGLQVQPVAAETVARQVGNRVAVSPIVTIEPRRRKFHKPITLTIPLPRPVTRGMTNPGESPTLRLLCSITGGATPATWEDITGQYTALLRKGLCQFYHDCVCPILADGLSKYERVSRHGWSTISGECSGAIYGKIRCICKADGSRRSSVTCLLCNRWQDRKDFGMSDRISIEGVVSRCWSVARSTTVAGSCGQFDPRHQECRTAKSTLSGLSGERLLVPPCAVFVISIIAWHCLYLGKSAAFCFAFARTGRRSSWKNCIFARISTN